MTQQSGQRWPVEHLVSAGGVVYRIGPLGMEIVVCGRDSDGIWGLPKGTPNPGESLEQTALREVSEETGLTVAIEDKIGSIQYWFSSPCEGIRYHKIVHHYLMVPTGGNTEDHDREYDHVEWFPLEQAYKLLSYANEVNIVRQAERLVTAKLGASGGLSGRNG